MMLANASIIVVMTALHCECVEALNVPNYNRLSSANRCSTCLVVVASTTGCRLLHGNPRETIRVRTMDTCMHMSSLLLAV